MDTGTISFGVVDKRFLAKSVGLLNPPEPVVMGEDDSVEDALARLKQHRIGCIVITDDHGKVSGIFSERDAILKVFGTELDPSTTPLSAVMTHSPHTEPMTCTLAFALNMMSEGGYRHIPLVDEGMFPVGILSVKNIIDYIVKTLNQDLAQL